MSTNPPSAVYIISVAAELAEVHPQTLRRRVAQEGQMSRDTNDEKRLWMWQVHPDLETLRQDPAWAEFWGRVEAKVQKLYRS